MLIFANANEIATCRSNGGLPRAGKHFGDCGIVREGAIAVDGSAIAAVGPSRKILRKFKSGACRVINMPGKIIVPGFVDCHTHAVFAGSRAEEYRLKLAGKSYAALHRARGGIHLTVAATRRATEQELTALARGVLRRMLRGGTTTVEIKSGYGLTARDELKILRVIQSVRKRAAQDVVATFLGAHTIPREYEKNRLAYVALLTEKLLPQIARKHLAEFCDVFCDPLGFTPRETSEILSSARANGLALKLHAEQTARYGGMRIAARFGATSADHCDFASDADIRLLKRAGSIAVLLPGVFFHLREWGKKPWMRNLAGRMKEAGLPIAIATDYNPGSSPVSSMKTVMDFAIRYFGLSYEEALNAATINAAHALGLGSRVGSLEKGKRADFLVVDAPTVADFLHEAGDGRIRQVIKRGKIVAE